MKKCCTKCGDKKSLSEFNKNKCTKDGLQYRCRECTKKHRQIHKVEISKRANRYYRTHKNEIAEQHKERKDERAEYQKKYRQTGKGKLIHKSPERSLKNRYGITLKQYDQMFEEQNGICAICGGINKSGRRLHLDHDHKTGKIRGLLCGNCNTGIGMLKENIDILCNAISYLKN